MSSPVHSCAAIIKFGGAALTDKRQIEHLNIKGFDACIRLASQLPPHSCIVHGAGSFGHFHAAQHNVKAGFTTATISSESQSEHQAARGMCETRRSVLKLNSMMFSALVDRGRTATPVHAMDSWYSSDAVLSSADLTSVGRCLQLNILPVLHGDVIFDSIRGFTILSGDDIVQELALRLRPPYVLFVSDVPGVFLEPPASASDCATNDPTFVIVCFVDGNGDILRIQSRNHEPAALEVGGSAGTDITGGSTTQFRYFSIVCISLLFNCVAGALFGLPCKTWLLAGMRNKLRCACCIAASGVPVAISAPNVSCLPPAVGSCTWFVWLCMQRRRCIPLLHVAGLSSMAHRYHSQHYSWRSDSMTRAARRLVKSE
jgi:isopentenyl phosphate kinase